MVAQDGSGNLGTIQEALDASLQRENSERFVIYVKQGMYQEYLKISYEMNNIMLVGDGMGKTIITGSNSYSKGYYSNIDTSTVRKYYFYFFSSLS